MLVHARRSWKKVLLILTMDLFLYNLGLMLAIFILSEYALVCPFVLWGFRQWLIENMLFISLFFILGVPFEIWTFTSVREALRISFQVAVSKLLSLPFYLMLGVRWQFSLNTLLISTMLTISLLLLPRVIIRLRCEKRKCRPTNACKIGNGNGNGQHRTCTRILLVGAGAAAEKVLREIESHPELNYCPIGLVDDSPGKFGSLLRQKRVLGSINELPSIIARNQIDEVLITMPSVRGDVIRRILSVIAPTQVKVKTLPGIWEMVDGSISAEAIRHVKVEDLLERDPIHTNVEEIGAYLYDQVVLVTGAGGSIGAELVRQIIRFAPRQVLMLGRGENRIFDIEREVRDKLKFPDAIPIIADMRDKDKMQWLFEHYRPTIVFHAAAHKHVPLMEKNPDEVITNNILGTRNLLKFATQYGSTRFVNISTDKAVYPANVMGASKRIIELMISAYNQINGTICTSVRFGNVLGSNGSVIQVFQRQLEETRTIKVTDKAMERFFMLIPEAVELVLQAGAMALGNDVFVLKMGNQVNIYEFAQSFIKLSGLELDKDAFIEIMGNRGNEKLSEELWTNEEHPQATNNPWILRVDCPMDGKQAANFIRNSSIFQPELIQFSSEDIKKAIYDFLTQVESYTIARDKPHK
jgi:FlaA1/EpsC-like NDP-sugar epimerase